MHFFVLSVAEEEKEKETFASLEILNGAFPRRAEELLLMNELECEGRRVVCNKSGELTPTKYKVTQFEERNAPLFVFPASGVHFWSRGNVYSISGV